MNESELYAPVKLFFEQMGYSVNGEVVNCDVTAVKDGELVIIELKRCLSVKLLAQGLDRQKVADAVYVAVPKPKAWARRGVRNKDFIGVRNVLQRLGLGLITVAQGRSPEPVELLITPETAGQVKGAANKRRRLRIENELDNRSADYNIGGSARRKPVTAYRERVVHIACLLERHGVLSIKEIKALSGIKNAARVLYDDYNDLFIRVGERRYALSDVGIRSLSAPDDEFAEVIAYYRSKIDGYPIGVINPEPH